MHVPLQQVAKALKIHPRTIMRYVTQSPNPDFDEDSNHEIDIDLLAFMLEVPNDQIEPFRRVMRGRDKAITPTELCAIYQITIRTFRNRTYPRLIDRHKFVRISLNEAGKYHIEHYVKEPRL